MMARGNSRYVEHGTRHCVECETWNEPVAIGCSDKPVGFALTAHVRQNAPEAYRKFEPI
jgi:hypothetical protein